MNEYLICIDASCDAIPSVAQNKQILFLPMPYTIDDETFFCKGTESDEELEDFYLQVKTGKMPTTSQIPPFEFEEAVSPYLEKGVSVLYLCLSGSLSSTYQSALTAKRNLKEKYPNADFIPVDSKLATGGIGVLLDRAIVNKKNGLCLEENAADLSKFIEKIAVYGFVFDLSHLKRGGRIGAATAMIGAMLNIKPVLKITPAGSLEVFDKQRGDKKAMQKLLDLYKNQANMQSDLSVYITESNNSEAAEYFAAAIQSVNPNAKIIVKRLTPIIGAHLGAGSIVIAFEKN
ncbi:MAG: DegV family protein [Clostridia bacterium]|nr:DegV family protein [Clostridia bacterium]